MPVLSTWMVRAALLSLGFGFALGAWMLSAKAIPFDPSYRRLLAPHIEVLLFGWLLQLAVGVALWILPRFGREPRLPVLELRRLCLDTAQQAAERTHPGGSRHWRTDIH